MNEDQLLKTAKEIQAVSLAAEKRAKNKWDNIGKPIDGLGLFEDMFIRIAGIKDDENFSLKNKYIAVMCSDNGVVAEGVSQTDSSVTAIVARNMAKGTSSVCLMSRCSGTKVIPYDVGMLKDVNGVEKHKAVYGTGNICAENAMSRSDAVKTIAEGIKIADRLYRNGCDIAGIGEMGIGNTTTSAAVCAVLADCNAETATGHGAGISDEGYLRKIDAVKRAVEFHKPDKNDVIGVLSSVGGSDIAALTGFIIGCAKNKIPVVLDGVITLVAALAAVGLNPNIKDYVIASHKGKEPACGLLLDKLGLKPVIYADMALGEGTGAAMLMSLINNADAVYSNNITFENINVGKYTDYGNK